MSMFMSAALYGVLSQFMLLSVTLYVGVHV